MHGVQLLPEGTKTYSLLFADIAIISETVGLQN